MKSPRKRKKLNSWGAKTHKGRKAGQTKVMRKKNDIKPLGENKSIEEFRKIAKLVSSGTYN